MNQSRHRRQFTVRALMPVLVIGVVVIASYFGAGVSADKERAVASRPTMSGQHAPSDKRAARALRAGMPALQSLAFEKNDGQADTAVKFLARAGDHDLLLTARAVIARSRAGSVGFTFAGASGLNIEAIEPLAGYRNYLLGNDPKKWRTQV